MAVLTAIALCVALAACQIILYRGRFVPGALDAVAQSDFGCFALPLLVGFVCLYSVLWRAAKMSAFAASLVATALAIVSASIGMMIAVNTYGT